MGWRRWIFLLMMVTALLNACTPSSGEPGLTITQSTPGGGSPALISVTPMTAQESAVTEAVASSPDRTDTTAAGEIVIVTPLSAEDLANQTPSQTDPGAGDGYGNGQAEPESTMTTPADSWEIYIDPDYGFAVAHPAEFVIGQLDAALLEMLSPRPAVAVYFVDPNTAESAFAGTDAPDLEVRIFDTGPVSSLDAWLREMGVVADGDGKTVTAYQTDLVSGLEVCESTMVFPACSVYIAGDSLVFQLRYLTLEGEKMAASFDLTDQ